MEIVSDLSPGDALAEFLAENDEPLRTVAVLGSRGHTGIKKLVFGSSAARLVSRDVVPCGESAAERFPIIALSLSCSTHVTSC